MSHDRPEFSRPSAPALIEDTICVGDGPSRSAGDLLGGDVEETAESAPMRAEWRNILTAEKNIACCLTLYNEPGPALAISIAAVIGNCAYLSKHGDSRKVILCIVADGAESLSEGAKEVLGEIGALDGGDIVGEPGLSIRRAFVDGEKWRALLHKIDRDDSETAKWRSIYRESIEGSEGRENLGHEESVQILFCEKPKNRGKLDSHWWFFAKLCPVLRPDYCLQLDAGTAPFRDAIYRLAKSLDSDPKIGAVASRILIGSDLKTFDFLHLWQFGDFLHQKLVEWPAEVMCGYLTVIPGQFCLFRWSALTGARKRPDPAFCDLGEGKPRTTPLQRYFRGLSPLGPFESNMFMAEDRILGFEVFSDYRQDWTLHYEPTGIAITDPCETLDELLKQRRRWSNSSLACNLWLIASLGKYLRDEKAPSRRKARMLTAGAWLVLNVAFQWFLPSILAIGLKGSLMGLLEANGAGSWLYFVARQAYYALLLLFAWQLSLFSKPTIDRASSGLLALAGSLYAGLFVVGLSRGTPLGWAAFGLEPLLLVGLALMYSKTLAVKMAKNSVPYLLMRPAVLVYIIMYSFSNLHDCKWGTKGLDHESDAPGGGPASRRRAARLRKFGRTIFGVWLVSNAGVIASLEVLNGPALAGAAAAISYLLALLVGIRAVAGFATAIWMARSAKEIVFTPERCRPP